MQSIQRMRGLEQTMEAADLLWNPRTSPISCRTSGVLLTSPQQGTTHMSGLAGSPAEATPSGAEEPDKSHVRALGVARSPRGTAVIDWRLAPPFPPALAAAWLDHPPGLQKTRSSPHHTQQGTAASLKHRSSTGPGPGQVASRR